MQVIHAEISYNKLLYTNSANNQCFDLGQKNSQIVGNMDF